MTTNFERAADLIYSYMSSWDDEAQAVNATQALADAGLLVAAEERQAHRKLRAGVQEMRDWYIDRSQRMRRVYAETFHSKFADRAECQENVADMLNDILEENK